MPRFCSKYWAMANRVLPEAFSALGSSRTLPGSCCQSENEAMIVSRFLVQSRAKAALSCLTTACRNRSQRFLRPNIGARSCAGLLELAVVDVGKHVLFGFATSDGIGPA